MVPESLTFDGIRMVQTAKRIEQLRAEHEAAAGKIKETRELLELTEEEKNKTLTELNELLELSSRENQLLRKQNEDLTAKNWSLESKLVSASGRKVGAGELITAPNTVEIYNGENSDIILAALKMYANHVPNASRRQDIINAIIDANKITGRNEELREAVERIFRQNQSSNYTEAMGNALRALGFAVEKSDHPKIYVPGHEQKMLKIAGTPSDTHTRNNEAKDVKNKLL
jgi:hypothetical protein